MNEKIKRRAKLAIGMALAIALPLIVIVLLYVEGSEQARQGLIVGGGFLLFCSSVAFGLKLINDQL